MRASAVESAFDRYVVPELPVLYRVARGLTTQPADAEDLVQDTLLRAFRALDSFDGRHPRAWLLTILRRAHLNRLRRRLPRLMDSADALDGTARDDPRAPTSCSSEEVVLRHRIIGELEAAVRALSPPHRRVVLLVDVAGLGYAEAARVLGVPEGTVMSRLYRARRRLRTQLATAPPHVSARDAA
ncbi:RNA polymerase sigma factor [Aquipuribacter nitratireducens]|uniref:RNA polymerase sigma factor n=1 Tax=Aquipuribacter nitratireducens TaxID=650104 RepID=A0ABW0GQ01_9MICO